MITNDLAAGAGPGRCCCSAVAARRCPPRRTRPQARTVLTGRSTPGSRASGRTPRRSPRSTSTTRTGPTARPGGLRAPGRRPAARPERPADRVLELKTPTGKSRQEDRHLRRDHRARIPTASCGRTSTSRAGRHRRIDLRTPQGHRPMNPDHPRRPMAALRALRPWPPRPSVSRGRRPTSDDALARAGHAART